MKRYNDGSIVGAMEGNHRCPRLLSPIGFNQRMRLCSKRVGILISFSPIPISCQSAIGILLLLHRLFDNPNAIGSGLASLPALRILLSAPTPDNASTTSLYAVKSICSLVPRCQYATITCSSQHDRSQTSNRCVHRHLRPKDMSLV